MFAPKFGRIIKLGRVKVKVTISCFTCRSRVGMRTVEGASRGNTRSEDDGVRRAGDYKQQKHRPNAKPREDRGEFIRCMGVENHGVQVRIIEEGAYGAGQDVGDSRAEIKMSQRSAWWREPGTRIDAKHDSVHGAGNRDILVRD
jgi:hypothetical protein